jgi:alpha-L-glutamate ligase-like protein
MKGLLYRWRALRQAHVLGLNQRNADYILPRNPRSHYPRVDDKLLTKQLAQTAGLPTPQLLGVISYHHELRGLASVLDKTADFVLKPARGTQGNGILVIGGREGAHYRKSSGTMVRFEQLRQHVSNTISGAFSLRGDWDHCLIEARVILHPAFIDLSRYGIPDVRVIVTRGVPVMAMCRLPTSLSDGRANLHQGAIGVGVDMGTGKTFNAVLHERLVTHHIDTNAPLTGFTIPSWDGVLSLAAQASELSDLGFVGVDIVIDEKHGPLLLELNARPGLTIQVANKEGLVDRLRRVDALAQSEISNWTYRCAIAREHFSRSASPQS